MTRPSRHRGEEWLRTRKLAGLADSAGGLPAGLAGTATSGRQAPRAARWESLTATLWTVFLIWSVLGAVVAVFGVGEAEVIAWTERHLGVPPHAAADPYSPFQAAILFSLRLLDPVWVILAAATVYAMTAAAEGIATARRWAIVILLVAGAVAGFSAKTGWPLGPIHFTDVLGTRLGPVPLCVPLFWFTIVTAGRDLVLRVWPKASQQMLAASTGALTLLMSIAVEPMARKGRVWWLWYTGMNAPDAAPLRNYLTWLAAGCALAYFLREATVAGSSERRGVASPAGVFVVLAVVFALTDVALLWRM